MNAPNHQLMAMQAADEKMRIHVAAQIAAGMASHPKAFEDYAWRNSIPFEAVNMADKIISAVRGA